MHKRYSNMDNVELQKTFRDFRRWRKERKAKRKDLSFTVPRVEKADTAYLRSNRSEPCLVWIGHSTFLIQHGGLNILTDPVWAGRMGLEKRLSEPGLRIEELPQIDIVLISHGHYDHLDFPTLRRLKGDPLCLVPAGLENKFRRKGFRRVAELNWWESHAAGPLIFSFVPAQHWTRRTLLDMNRSHWGGWVIQPAAGRSGAEPTVYFAGDSGYFRGFREIGARFDIDVALLPIGAYEPEWFMSAQHVTPEEAVQAFLDVGADTFVPMHYGAFRLADDTPREALERLHEAWSAKGLDTSRLKVLKLGEIYKMGKA